jgi:hypothetical protein
MAEIVEQILREAPEIEARKLQLIDAARTLANQPINLPAYQAAPMSQLETQGINLGAQGIGAYAPFIQAGQRGIEAGLTTTGAAAQQLAGINVAPQYQQAQQVTGQGLVPTAALGSLAGAAGAGMPAIAAGTGAVGAAQGMIPYGAQLDPSQAMLQQAAAASTAGTGGYNPYAASAFMNPYQQAVTQNALGEMRRQADIARQGQAAQAVRAGAFGGTREGVQRAEFERGVQDLMGQRIMQDYAANYAQAQQAAQSAFEQQQQRQLGSASQLGQLGGTLGQQALSQAQLGQAGAGLLGQLGSQQAQLGLLPAQIAGQQANILGSQAQLYNQLGQGIGSLAGQYGQLETQRAATLGQAGATLGQLGMQQGTFGEAVQKLGQQDVNALLSLGQLQRQQQQSQLEAQRLTQMQSAMTPYQQLGFVSDIYKGAPTSQSTLGGTSSSSPSPLLQAVSLGIAGASAMSGAQKAGLFS